jgi:hypothetical protein
LEHYHTHLLPKQRNTNIKIASHGANILLGANIPILPKAFKIRMMRHRAVAVEIILIRFENTVTTIAYGGVSSADKVFSELQSMMVDSIEKRIMQERRYLYN